MNKTKECTVCPIGTGVKNVSEFSKSKKGKYGVSSICKTCINKRRLERDRTRSGLIKRIYKDQIKSSKKRSHVGPSYTLDELISFCMSSSDFLRLYRDWRNSGYEKMLSPSIDRRDDYEPYSIDNIRVLLKEEEM